jgi:hypothetical protein
MYLVYSKAPVPLEPGLCVLNSSNSRSLDIYGFKLFDFEEFKNIFGYKKMIIEI